MTCSIYKKHELKVLQSFSNTGILTQLNFKLCRTDKNFISVRRYEFYQIHMVLCRMNTCFFLFIKLMIGVWTTVFSRVKTCPNNLTLVLKYMSDGNISILGNRKKVCYKYNITDLPWNTFLLEGTIVWYNSHHYPIYRWNWMVKR